MIEDQLSWLSQAVALELRFVSSRVSNLTQSPYAEAGPSKMGMATVTFTKQDTKLSEATMIWLI